MLQVPFLIGRQYDGRVAKLQNGYQARLATKLRGEMGPAQTEFDRSVENSTQHVVAQCPPGYGLLCRGVNKTSDTSSKWFTYLGSGSNFKGQLREQIKSSATVGSRRFRYHAEHIACIGLMVA